VQPINCHGAAPTIIRGYEIKRQAPCGYHFVREVAAGFLPAEGGAAARVLLRYMDVSGFCGVRVGTQLESIEIIGAERGHKNPVDLLVIRRYSQFFGRATDGEIVDENLTLLKRALSNAPQFAKVQIVERLNANPHSGSKHGQHQP